MEADDGGVPECVTDVVVIEEGKCQWDKEALLGSNHGGLL
jgi:hypothetical protein